MVKRALREIVTVYWSSRDYTVTMRLACGHEYVYQAGNEIGMESIYEREIKRLHKRIHCELCVNEINRLESYAPIGQE